MSSTPSQTPKPPPSVLALPPTDHKSSFSPCPPPPAASKSSATAVVAKRAEALRRSLSEFYTAVHPARIGSVAGIVQVFEAHGATVGELRELNAVSSKSMFGLCARELASCTQVHRAGNWCSVAKARGTVTRSCDAGASRAGGVRLDNLHRSSRAAETLVASKIQGQSNNKSEPLLRSTMHGDVTNQRVRLLGVQASCSKVNSRETHWESTISRISIMIRTRDS